MSAEPSQTTIADAWSQWQNQVVQGRFVLRRCLGWSDQSAVFLTEHKAKNLAEAAIKFVRADAPQAQPLLVRWQAAVNVSHAHLVQLFEVGRWQIEGQDYLFVVMEYGDQTLAEILRRRPLDAGEVQELLPPVLDALTFLHRRQLVHSQLKPSNFLAVGDQLKLASDTMRPAGQDHGNSTAGDVWGLGAALLEALTARPRVSVDQPFDAAGLPPGLPASLAETVRRCLSVSPADRPSIIELRAEYKRGPQLAAAAKPEPQVQKVTAPSPVAPVSSQPSPSASPVATSIPPVANAPREPSPYQPVQTASRVTVSFHAVPTNPPAPAQPQPVSSASTVIARPKQVRQDIAPPTPTPIPRSATASPRPSAPAAAAPQAPALSPTARSATRDTAPRPPAGLTAQAAVPSQPAPSAPREGAPSQVTNIAPRSASPVQSVAPAQREITPPQPANIASRAASPIQPPPSTLRATASPQGIQAGSQQAPAENAPKRHFVGIAVGGLLLATAVWIGLRSTNDSPATLRPAAIPAPVQPPPERVAESKPTPAAPVSPLPEEPVLPAATSASVLNEVLPSVPEKIQSEIQGRIYVTVRALVDPDGNVMAVLMENAGPSKYFARISDKAAREWQFVAADTDAARVWLLRFEYTRDGVSVRAFEQ